MASVIGDNIAFWCSLTEPKARDCFDIWSSEQAHTVDALAAGGDEGRWSLRNASGSRQPDCEPEMSEWGNPLTQVSISFLNT